MPWQREATSRSGRRYVQSEHDGAWWIVLPYDRPNQLVGATHNLPEEIKRQLSIKEE